MTGQRTAAAILLIVYAAATLYVGLHHEPWRDEADSWLVVRDASLPAIFEWTRDAGTPALWYLALKPLVWLGLPYQSQELLHLALAWAAAAVVLFASPFPWLTRVLLIASYYLGYEYAVIARSYVLTVLLSFLAAAFYRERRSRPIRYAIVVALLFNTNVHGAIIAAILLLLFFVWRPRARGFGPASIIGPALIMVLGAIAAWAQLRTAPDAAYPGIVREIQPMNAWLAIGSAFFAGIPWQIGAIAGVALVLTIAYAVRKKRDALLFLALSLVLLEILFVFVWFGGFRHAGLLLLCAVVAMWLARDVPQFATVALTISLAVLTVFCGRMAAADIEMNFSGSREMGTFIAANRLGRYDIAAHNFHACEAVLPYVPGKTLWYAALNRTGTYMLWNRDERFGLAMPYDVAVVRSIEHFAPRKQPWLLLLNAPIPERWSPQFRLVYATRAYVYRHPDERYWLYEYQGSTR